MAKESIDALLNPFLKVSRPVAACARCRNAKIKCDGRLPACSGCERAGKAKECSSASDEFARGKERSYASALETAVQRLQRRLEEAKTASARRESSSLFAHDRPVLQRKPISNSRRKEAGNVDELVSDFGFLTVNATSRDFQGFASTMSFAKMLKAIALKEPLPLFDDMSLPPRYSISNLISHYFENFHVLLPFFSETDFMSSLSRIYQEHSNISAVSPFDLWCFHLVLAVASASLSQNRGDEHHDVAVFNLTRAMGIDEHVIHPGSISGIQALLLLVQYALVDPEYLDSWYVIGMASRLLVDLGLHCEPSPETKCSKQMLDLRRRVFYCTYALDRLVSMALGFAFSFTDDSAPNVLLPTLSTDQEARSPTQVFLRSIRPSLFLFDIRRVESAYYQKTRWSSRDTWAPDFATTYVASTLEDIRAWQSTLPESFSVKHLRLLKLEATYSQVLVLSPSQVIPSAIIPDTHKNMLLHYAVQYSEQLRTMVRDEELRSCLNYVECCRARYVSRQFQNLLWDNFDMLIKGDVRSYSPPHDAGQGDNCNRALCFLGNMSQILEWPKQRWGISALKEIFEQESAVLLARLQTRQQEQLASQTSSTTTTPSEPYSSALPSEMRRTDQHVHIDQYTNAQMPSEHSYIFDFQSQHGLTSGRDGYHTAYGMQNADSLQSNPGLPFTSSGNSQLPAGSLPRRSYQFMGGQG
ncbi:hypothetical protein LTR64_006848 [Lithohypha guttulata]|uniref:uncharacterized protein n=1 Tax=Lithohypha guttulata TaxID=1690604 RepID=UPI002DE12ADC|nr:hypothetical protein LTR51_004594 [Lithohypha guttulata]